MSAPTLDVWGGADDAYDYHHLVQWCPDCWGEHVLAAGCPDGECRLCLLFPAVDHGLCRTCQVDLMAEAAEA